ncbi:MAG TPA: TonB-dependent receptor [Steroidobacteraceae bacterium]|nr:TonB-dependent receptor [Steroidobacteraceae bacterium]
MAGVAPVLAQEQSAPEVVVTGSRIRTDPLNQPAPLSTVTDQDIARTGTTSVGDVLQRLTASGGGLNTKFNTSGNTGFPPDQGGVGAGAATIDLRHLGAKRVLVLVDGMRWVNESSASGVSSATDLNTIPVSIIDHVEVLQDGASSIYGSDAIAGVVNIITRRSFNGLQFSGYGGAFDEGDGQNRQFSISTGTSTDMLNAFLDISYSKQDEVRSQDREISRFPTPGVGACTARCSSGTPAGRYVFTDPNTGVEQSITINPGVTGTPVYISPATADAPRTDDFHNFTVADRFNFQPYNFILTPNERFSVYAQGETHLTDAVSFYLKGLFNNRRSTNQAAPEPLFIGTEAGNGVGNLLDVTSISRLNPYNPFGFDLTQGYVVFRRPVEGGPRVFTQDVDTYYFNGGFKGDFNFANRDFAWDVNAAWSRNAASQITHGSYNALKIGNALGPGGHDANGNLVCGTPDGTGLVTSPIPNCVPLNIFGENTITPEMLRYIQPILHDSSEQELRDFTANLTGTIAQLPAGGLDFAVGYEHRKQSGEYQPDQIYVAGESAGVPSLPTKGEYDVDEYFAELRIPVLRGVPGADLLQLSAAARSSDYSLFGSDTTTKFGLNWRPVSDLLLRGTFAEGVRAPGIGELFGSFARFDTTIQDPCSNFSSKPAATQANCMALGVPASYTQSNPQISVVTGGNPALVPETSDGYTAGFVYSPAWAQGVPWSDNLTFDFTWWRITLDQTILARDAQVQLDGCVATLDPVLCGGIGRTAAGTINRFNNQLINIGGTRTKGYDVNLHYVIPETRAGRFGLTWQNTILDEYVDILQTSTGFTEVKREGTERGDTGQAFPKWKSALTVDWGLRDFAAAVTLRYTDSVIESCRDLQGLGLCSNYNLQDDNLSTNKMDAVTYVDLQATWRPAALDDAWAFTLGVNNLFDEDAPFCFSCASNSFDASTYDVPGVFWYARVVAHFGRK